MGLGRGRRLAGGVAAGGGVLRGAAAGGGVLGKRTAVCLLLLLGGLQAAPPAIQVSTGGAGRGPLKGGVDKITCLLVWIVCHLLSFLGEEVTSFLRLFFCIKKSICTVGWETFVGCLTWNATVQIATKVMAMHA